MSSLVSTVVAPTSSIVASSSNQNAAKAADAPTSNASNTGAHQAAGQAAVVNFSASSKNRAPSSGDSKSVDASFEKQALKEQKASKKDDSGNEESPGGSINVAA
jgi:hypothetical protein